MVRQEMSEFYGGEGVREANDSAYRELHPDGRPSREPTTLGERLCGVGVIAAFGGIAALIVALTVSKIGLLAIIAGVLVVSAGIHAGRLTASEIGHRRIMSAQAPKSRPNIVT
jgi:hypothetical protein